MNIDDCVAWTYKPFVSKHASIEGRLVLNKRSGLIHYHHQENGCRHIMNNLGPNYEFIKGFDELRYVVASHPPNAPCKSCVGQAAEYLYLEEAHSLELEGNLTMKSLSFRMLKRYLDLKNIVKSNTNFDSNKYYLTAKPRVDILTLLLRKYATGIRREINFPYLGMKAKVPVLVDIYYAVADGEGMIFTSIDQAKIALANSQRYEESGMEHDPALLQNVSPFWFPQSGTYEFTTQILSGKNPVGLDLSIIGYGDANLGMFYYQMGKTEARLLSGLSQGKITLDDICYSNEIDLGDSPLQFDYDCDTGAEIAAGIRASANMLSMTHTRTSRSEYQKFLRNCETDDDNLAILNYLLVVLGF